MKFLNGILSALCRVGNSAVFAIHYYISSALGNDAWSGMFAASGNPEGPWQSPVKVKAAPSLPVTQSHSDTTVAVSTVVTILNPEEQSRSLVGYLYQEVFLPVSPRFAHSSNQFIKIINHIYNYITLEQECGELS